MRCPAHGPHCNGRGYWTDCPTCGREVFYYQCDHGSKVFFDDVGNGWPKHECYVAQRTLPPELQAAYASLQALSERAGAMRASAQGRKPSPKRPPQPLAMPTTVGSRVRGFLGRLTGAPVALRVKVPPVKGMVARPGALVRKTATVQDIRYVLPRAEQTNLQVIRKQERVSCLKECLYGTVTLYAYDAATNTVQRYTCFAPSDDLDDLDRNQRVQAEMVAQTLAGGRTAWVCVRLMPDTR